MQYVISITFLVVSISVILDPSIMSYIMAISDPDSDPVREKVPVAVSGDNVYVSWWSNKTTGNDEVLFRASTDGGTTFGDKINLSNTTNMESVDAMIDAEGDTVAVTWWERNSTSNEPVMKVSTDAGETFGPLLQLSQNGTLDTVSEE